MFYLIILLGVDVSVFQLGEGAGKVESPQQKYLRLQHELRELTEEVNSIKVCLFVLP